MALLKGPTTAVASPDERVLLALAGTPALATAGTGDVLSGVIGAMLARGVDPAGAAALAAHVHGRAGARGPGEGLVAGDLPDLVAGVLRPDLRAGRVPPWLTTGGRPGPTSISTPCGTTPRCWPPWSGPAALCAVVKADGYGHGALPVARAALQGGATWLAVALVEEGVSLRDGGIEAPILLLSEPPVEAMAEAVARRLVPTVYTDDGIAAPEPGGGRGGRPPVAVHLKVDTGMHRVGADPGGRARPWPPPSPPIPALALGAVWTHLAVAEAPIRRPAFTAVQLERFEAVVAALAAAGHRPPLTHAANSAAAIGIPSAATRPGALRHRPLRGGPDPGPGPRDRRPPPAASACARSSPCAPG